MLCAPVGASSSAPIREWCPEYPCCNGSGVILGAVLRPRIQKNSGGPVVSPSLSSSSPHGERARERTGLPSNAKGRTSSRRASSTPNARKRAPRMTPPNEQRPFGSPIGKGVERRLSRRRLGEGVLCAPVGAAFSRTSGVVPGAGWERACFARPLERRVSRSGVVPGAGWEGACFARPLERRVSRSGVVPGAGWEGACFARPLERRVSRSVVVLGADWEGACFARPLERRVSRSGVVPGADWEGACFARPLGRRLSRRRLSRAAIGGRIRGA